MLQPLDLLTHARRLFVEFFTRDQVVSVHVHVLLTAFFQLRELLRQLLFVVDVLVLRLVDAFKLIHHVSDHVFLRLHDLGEVRLQDGDQLILVHRHRVGAGIRAAAVVAGADPADIGVFISADGAAERPAAVLALDQRGEQILVAVALPFHFEGLGARAQDLLRLLEDLRLDDPQLRAVGNHPLVLGLVRAAAGEEVRDLHLLLTVDDLAGVELVRENAADRVLAPVAAALGLDAAGVEHVRDL